MSEVARVAGVRSKSRRRPRAGGREPTRPRPALPILFLPPARARSPNSGPPSAAERELYAQRFEVVTKTNQWRTFGCAELASSCLQRAGGSARAAARSQNRAQRRGQRPLDVNPPPRRRYITTAHGKRPLPEVLADINTWCGGAT